MHTPLSRSSSAPCRPFRSRVLPLRPRHLLLTLLVTVAGPIAAASADDARGLVLGASVGVGRLHMGTCSDGSCQAARDVMRVSLPNLKVGWMVRPRTALLFTIPTGIHVDAGAHRSFEGFVPAVQQWVGPRVWLQGGAGIAMDAPVIFTSPHGFHAGPAVVGAAGVQLARRGRGQVNLEVRTTAARLGTAGGGRRPVVATDILVGFTWNRS